MLRLALTFFIIAIVAGVLGFGGIAAGAVALAEVFFWGAVILFAIFLVAGLYRPAGKRW